MFGKCYSIIKHSPNLFFRKGLSFILFPFIYPLIWCWARYYRKYQILDIKKHRKIYKQLIKQGKPILVCPNHLTYIDSAIIAFALGSWSFYQSHFNAFPWNLPKQKNVIKNKIHQFFCLIGKCLLIPIDSTKAKRVLDDSQVLLTNNESLLIFPEGTRSHSGRINTQDVVYGIGDIYLKTPDCGVLLIYLRGKGQSSRSELPSKGMQFHLDLKFLKPSTSNKGLRAKRDISQQIIQALENMESTYFINHPDEN